MELIEHEDRAMVEEAAGWGLYERSGGRWTKVGTVEWGDAAERWVFRPKSAE